LGGPDEKALEAAYALIEESHEAIKAQKNATVFKCGSCLAMTPIADLEYVQTYWYTEPHGCTGGDYWNAGEGKVLCPACGVESRTAYSPGLAELSGFFGSHSDRRKG
jgi:hypothetical protein